MNESRRAIPIVAISFSLDRPAAAEEAAATAPAHCGAAAVVVVATGDDDDAAAADGWRIEEGKTTSRQSVLEGELQRQVPLALI